MTSRVACRNGACASTQDCRREAGAAPHTTSVNANCSRRKCSGRWRTYIMSATAKPNMRSRVLAAQRWTRSEEHTSELQSLMRISYAVFCLKKKNTREHQYELMYLTT